MKTIQQIMQYSIAKDIFGSPWHIHVTGFQQFYPLARGMMNGAVFQEEAEPKENLPFSISKETKQHVEISDASVSADGGAQQEEKVIHVLPVRGVMMKHDMACGPRGMRTLANRLRKADADPRVIGHLIIWETPGGAANSVPEIAEAIQDLKKFNLGLVDGIACSAGKYGLSYCQERWAARETDIIGSIGTMMVLQGRTAKSEENLFGERQVTIYADEAFEKNEEYETAINKFDVKLVKDRVLNPHNKQFVDDIKANCPNVEDKHLHGRTFQASEVVGVFVDRIGTFDEAIDRIIEMHEKNDVNTNGSQQQNHIVEIEAQHNDPYKDDIKIDVTAQASQQSTEEKPPATTTEDKNNSNTMKQFKHVNETLNVEQLESQDGVVSFNEEQLEALDTKLGSDNSQEIQGQLDTANTTIASQKSTIEAHEATIASQNAEIARLKGGAAEDTTPKPKGDDTDLNNEKSKTVVNDEMGFGEQVDAVAAEYLPNYEE